MEKMKFETKDLSQSNVEKIGELFPNCLTEMKDENGNIKKGINFKVLKQMLSGEVVDEGDEAYEFTWVGKKDAMVEANKPIKRTLRPCKEESKDWDTTGNLYIEGDNLEVLKLLQESYLNSVKMIYIDPPYNTGNDFIYNDKYSKSKKEYDKKAGAVDEDDIRLVKNTDANGEFHSDWCSMMYSRLLVAKEILDRNGLIFISIDDNEYENLVKICNEVLGEKNFYGTIVQLKRNAQNDSKSIQKNHEYILCYSKTGQDLLATYRNKVEKELIKDESFKYTDSICSNKEIRDVERYYYEGTENGVTGNSNTLYARKNLGYSIYYYEGDIEKFEKYESIEKKYGFYREYNVYKKDNKIFHAIALMDYDIDKVKKGVKEDEVYSTNKELISAGYRLIRPPKRKGNELGRWTWGIDRFKNLWNNNEVVVKKGDKIIKKEFVDENSITKKKDSYFYIKENKFPMKSILDIPSSSGTKDLMSIFEKKEFDNPKSVELLKTLISSCTEKDSIILDFFSGSGTTAQAVMELNSEDNGKRKFIMVQLPEKLEDNKFENICEIGKERIRRAGEKIKSDNTDKEGIENLDIGFRVLKVADSNMKDVFYIPDKYQQSFLDKLESNIKEDRTALDLLFGCLLEWGLPLNREYESKNIGENTVHIYNGGDLIACFDEGISEDVVKQIANMEPLRVVFRDSSFETSADKINVEEIFKLLSPETSLRVI